jgi:phosphoketolase
VADSFARYEKKGNINTPIELAINNQTDRFNVAIDAILKKKSGEVEFRSHQGECRRPIVPSHSQA